MISTLFEVRIAEQPLLGRGALAAQAAALADRKLLCRACSTSQASVRSRLSPPSSRCLPTAVRVKSIWSPSRETRIRAEVAGAAADVADQHDLAVEQHLARLREVVGDPGIERRRGLFEQRQLLDARLRRAALTVSSRASSSKDAGTVSTTSCSASGAPCCDLSHASRMLREKRAETSTGDSTRPPLLRIPRQDLRGAVHVGIREPGLGASAPAWWERARPVRGRRRRRAGPSSRKRNEGSVRRGFDAAGGDELRDLEDVDGRETRCLRASAGSM